MSSLLDRALRIHSNSLLPIEASEIRRTGFRSAMTLRRLRRSLAKRLLVEAFRDALK